MQATALVGVTIPLENTHIQPCFVLYFFLNGIGLTLWRTEKALKPSTKTSYFRLPFRDMSLAAETSSLKALLRIISISYILSYVLNAL